MKKLTKEEIEKITSLANLDLTEEEKVKFGSQLSEVIDYNVGELAKVKTEYVEPLTNVTGLSNTLREDEAQPSLSQEDAISNAPSTHNGYFKVKGILD